MPVKWVIDFDESWYFEKDKNTNIWYQRHDKIYLEDYLQISEDFDKNGNPVINISRSRDNQVIELAEGISYSIQNSSKIKSKFEIGHWAKRNITIISKG